mmetsp:Transcript_457/g.1270  ORF Transcript_457/g.1270 Transcript_457/m.1270 type:complete len:232 (+) Transcript_457:212-907(+)
MMLLMLLMHLSRLRSCHLRRGHRGVQLILPSLLSSHVVHLCWHGCRHGRCQLRDVALRHLRRRRSSSSSRCRRRVCTFEHSHGHASSHLCSLLSCSLLRRYCLRLCGSRRLRLRLCRGSVRGSRRLRCLCLRSRGAWRRWRWRCAGVVIGGGGIGIGGGGVGVVVVVVGGGGGGVLRFLRSTTRRVTATPLKNILEIVDRVGEILCWMISIVLLREFTPSPPETLPRSLDG